jgi:predicted transcriptional regulator
MSDFITMRDLLNQLDRKGKAKLADQCGTTLGYLRKLAYGQCAPSMSMFRKLCAADPRLTADSFIPKEIQRAQHAAE